MAWTRRFREQRKAWQQASRGRPYFQPARPQIEILEDRLVPSGNVLPAIHLPVHDSLAANEIFSESGSFSDPQGSSWIAHVDYGDGTGLAPLPLKADHTFLLNHTYAHEGIFDVTVVVEDNLGETAQAGMRVHAEAILGMRVPNPSPVFSPAPLIPFVPPNQSPFSYQSSVAQNPYPGFIPGYLVEGIDDNSTGLKSDPVDAQVARESSTENQPGTTSGQQPGNQSNTLLPEKLQKTRPGAGPNRPAPKKTAEPKPDYSYQPKHHSSRQEKPVSNQPRTKKNFHILFHSQPEMLQREELATQLLTKRSPGNVLLAVLVLGWGIKRPNFRNVKRWERNRPRRRSRCEMPKFLTVFLGRIAAARAPP